ncbi:hypothetical protein JCM3770_005825 [Rhodotorula araucariae]
MDWLADRVDSLAKQAAELSVYDVKAAVRKAQAYAFNYTEAETRVREATNDEPWGASSSLMQTIAQDTFNFQTFNEIMPTLYSRFTEKEAREWRQIYKALQLLEYLVKNGSERVVDDARSHLSLVRVLRNFHYVDENGKDQGINIRNRAKELGDLLSDVERVRQERRKAKQNRNKYQGVGNDGFSGGSGGFSSIGGGGPSFTSASGSRYGGFGSDSLGHGGGGDAYSSGGGSGGGFSDSRGRQDDFEAYDAGDDEDLDVRRAPARASASASASSSSRASRAAGTNKPTPPPPAQAAPPPPKQPEVNLFDFDDDDEPVVATPAPPPKPAAPAPASAFAFASSAVADDDFDDFQSAAPVPAPAPRTAPTANVFALLQPASGSPAAAAPPAYQARPPAAALQPALSAGAPRTPAQPPAQAKKPAAADDFSDLFALVAPSPAASSSSSSSKPGAAGAGVGKQSLAEIAAQKRQDSLFGAAGGTGAGGANKGLGAGDGWDSLL